MTTVGDVTLIGSDLMCSATGAFHFTRPEGYVFRAGQYFRLTIATSEGEQTHSFSHADAPGDDALVVVTRLTGSPFKTALLAMKPGDSAKAAGPYGKLVLEPGMDKIGFLVGGVGITPMRSIMRDVVAAGTRLDAVIFDGNMDESCVPFKDEFDGYEAASPGIRFVHTLATPSDEWTGERGFITADLVRRHCEPLGGRHWFVCGPPAMVDAMRIVIEQLAVPVELQHFELFTGY